MSWPKSTICRILRKKGNYNEEKGFIFFYIKHLSLPLQMDENFVTLYFCVTSHACMYVFMMSLFFAY